MKISVILGHPKVGSFNHAIANTAVETIKAKGHEALFHDLYAEGFDPLLTAPELDKDPELPPEIEKHCQEIEGADGVIIVHPNWWSQPPAILRGWTDRCLRNGRAYQFVPDGKGGATPEGLLKARFGIAFYTSNTPHEIEEEVYGDPLQTLWLKVVFGLCGIKDVTRRNFTSIIVSSHEQRVKWLDEVRETVSAYLD
ncbi:MAG: NAD(P)H-dependent oxidoreductase [Verrucomicrobia bacterium]|nr:NAD(P)H-dependent oxidoreductase [Verrucomicrobiota bacterium]MCF7707434.1 NAD(P)H-dependent oxidoreductase [Verrucomicrobiota bacterium]